MRYYKVNNIEHTVFDNVNELPKDFKFLPDWKDGHVSDWVLADDGCIVQILREGIMIKSKGATRKVRYVGTCVGTFVVSSKAKMDASKRVNIYSFGGNIDRDQRLEERVGLSSREELFVQYLASGLDARKAYLKAFPTNDPHYAGMRAGQLLKTTRVRTAMKEELKPILKALGINETSLLRNIYTIAQTAQKDDTKLKALFKLADIMDLEDKNKTAITQISGAVFQGFEQKQIENVKRPEQIEGKE
tara:strand:- start:4287 stop:5024 length:738 start_codon:yes stop_codon:yes gene_type:complete